MSKQTTLDEYQEATEQTAIYPRGRSADARLPEIGVLYTALGLVGEAGEIAEKLKKYIREQDPQYLEDIEDELGDVLWYWARNADEMGLNAGEIADANLDKLLDRQERGVLEGEGDDR